MFATYLLAVILTVTPVRAQFIAEYRTLADCQRAIASIPDKDVQKAAICMPIAHEEV